MENDSAQDNLGNKMSKMFPKNVDENNNLKSKAVNKTMIEQMIAPPAHIWDKIESVLDQQQNRRETGSEIITASLRKTQQNRKQVYLVTAAGLTVIAGFLWIIL